MFSHVTLGISDFGRALGFWRPVMAALGHAERFADPAKPWAAWQPAAGGRPLFIIMQPFDGKAPAPGNGPMVAFAAPDRATVRAAHAAALDLGKGLRTACNQTLCNSDQVVQDGDEVAFFPPVTGG